MKRRRTLGAHICHYYNNKTVKIRICALAHSIQQGDLESASKAFLDCKTMIDGILPPLKVIDEISETNSSDLPQEAKDALGVLEERFNSFKLLFEGMCDEFPQSLTTCPKTFAMALDMIGLEYDPIVECNHLNKFRELY